jgi:hypothetical protein
VANIVGAGAIVIAGDVAGLAGAVAGAVVGAGAVAVVAQEGASQLGAAQAAFSDRFVNGHPAMAIFDPD